MLCPLLDAVDPLFSPILTDWRSHPSIADEVAERIELAYLRSQLFLSSEGEASVSPSEEVLP